MWISLFFFFGKKLTKKQFGFRIINKMFPPFSLWFSYL